MPSRSALGRLAVAATVAALSAVAVPRAGATVTAEQGYLARFLPIARVAWPGNPCLGRETITTDASLAAPWVAMAWPEECRVVISRGLSAREFCNVLVHEIGHLAGLENLTNRPDDVMNEAPGDWPACVAATRPTLSGATRLVVPPPGWAWRLTIGPRRSDGCRFVRARRPGRRERRYEVCLSADDIAVTETPLRRPNSDPSTAVR